MIPPSITAKMGRALHRQKGHPICTVKELLTKEFLGFEAMDEIPALCSTEENFDSLLIPKDHPSRSESDTFYMNPNMVLRTHTSAHQVKCMQAGIERAIITGDVYRKDEIDATHYPVFHQMEGYKLVNALSTETAIIHDLMYTVNDALASLFPASKPVWKKDYFPFTNPSWEVEVDGLEVLGCGIIHPDVLKNGGATPKQGWAFGLGLDRLAMKLFSIPDIRLFWSEDQRFLSQFEAGKISTFKPFSKHPSCYKDISIWVPSSWNKNDFMGVVREVAGDLAEEVKEIDSYNKGDRISKCYRITFRSMERTLSNEEIDTLQERIREAVSGLQGVVLR